MPLTSPSLPDPTTRQRHPGAPKLAAMGNPINRAAASPIRRAHCVRPTTRWTAAVIGLVAAARHLGDGVLGRRRRPRATTTRPRRRETTTTTQPPATDEASHEVVEELVLEATELADELFQDPTAVEDPDNEALDRLREIYTDDSPTPDGVEDQLRELVATGQHQRPSGERDLPRGERLRLRGRRRGHAHLRHVQPDRQRDGRRRRHGRRHRGDGRVRRAGGPPRRRRVAVPRAEQRHQPQQPDRARAVGARPVRSSSRPRGPSE